MNARRVLKATSGALLVAATILTASACTDTRGRLYVRIGPPAPIIETRAVAPGPGYVWIQGYQRWDGGRYIWEPGRWERPPHAGARWAAGHWSRDGQGWYYVDGRWR